MQCPNCGKEAINVNGKFVCLDCGVQIDSAGGAMEPPVTNSIGNHDEPISLPTDPDSPYEPQPQAPVASEPTPEPAMVAAPVTESATATPSVASPAIPDFPADPTPQATPEPTVPASGVKDYYLNALNDAGGAADFSQPTMAAPPATPTSSNPTDNVTSPEPTSNSAAPPADPLPAASNQPDNDTVVPSTTPAPPPSQEEPITQEKVIPAPQIDNTKENLEVQQALAEIGATADTPATPELPADQSPFVPPSQTISTQSEPSGSEPPVSEPNESARPSENYFQPQTVDIAGTEPANPNPTPAPLGPPPPAEQPAEATEAAESPKAGDTFDAFSTPQGSNLEPKVEELLTPEAEIVKEQKEEQSNFPGLKSTGETETQNKEGGVAPPASEEKSEEQSEPPADQGNKPLTIDELLAQSSKEAPLTPPPGPFVTAGSGPGIDTLASKPTPPAQPAVTEEPKKEENHQFSIPGSNRIPSADSVFGTTPQPESEVPMKKSFSAKKIIFIIVGILVFLGLIFGVMMLLGGNGNSNQDTSRGLNQEQVFEVSNAVSQAMDTAQNLEVVFDQSVDFSKITLKPQEGELAQTAEALKTVVAKAQTNKGKWETDDQGNASVDANFNGVLNRKIYNEGGRQTYTYAADSSSWTRAEGTSLASIPSLYPLQNKGAIFYMTKIDNMSDLGGETIDGKVYKKIGIVPKPDFVELLISETNPFLANTRYQSANFENMQMIAWLNEENKIFKVTLNGDVGIDSNLFSGTVSFKSIGQYNYKDVTISVPGNVVN